MSSWEDQMAAKAAARRRAQHPEAAVPHELRGELPPGEPDIPRYWCTTCGLPDPPQRPDKYSPPAPCPRCGSVWQWQGRITDRDGTADGPPGGTCLDCFAWRRYPGGQAHFGWAWWLICDSMLCKHAHHANEIWLAALC